MNTNKILLSTLVGGAACFLLSWLLYGILLAKFFAANKGTATGVEKAQMEFWALIVGNLAVTLLLAIIFSRWAGIKTFATGAWAGALIFLLIALSFDLIMYGTSNIANLTATLIDPLVFGAIGAVTGGIVGWVMGTGKKE